MMAVIDSSSIQLPVSSEAFDHAWGNRHPGLQIACQVSKSTKTNGTSRYPIHIRTNVKLLNLQGDVMIWVMKHTLIITSPCRLRSFTLVRICMGYLDVPFVLVLLLT